MDAERKTFIYLIQSKKTGVRKQTFLKPGSKLASFWGGDQTGEREPG